MTAIAVRVVKVPPRPTAVVAQTTTWEEFPNLWGRLLSEVYAFVRSRTDLATGSGGDLWQNVMLYKDKTPDVEIGVLVSGSFEPQGRVIPSELPGERSRPRPPRATTPGWVSLMTPCATTSPPPEVNLPDRAGKSTDTSDGARAWPRTEVFWLLR